MQRKLQEKALAHQQRGSKKQKHHRNKGSTGKKEHAQHRWHIQQGAQTGLLVIQDDMHALAQNAMIGAILGVWPFLCTAPVPFQA